MVTALPAGPLHAEVTVTPSTGQRFSYVENRSRSPLREGQAVVVRFAPASPRATARLATAEPDRTAGEVALMGLALLLAAALSPWLAARFPHLLASPIRP